MSIINQIEGGPTFNFSRASRQINNKLQSQNFEIAKMVNSNLSKDRYEEIKINWAMSCLPTQKLSINLNICSKSYTFLKVAITLGWILSIISHISTLEVKCRHYNKQSSKSYTFHWNRGAMAQIAKQKTQDCKVLSSIPG